MERLQHLEPLNIKLLQEINQIISEIEAELNQLDRHSKRQMQNTVYMLGNNFINYKIGKVRLDKYFSFVICKTFFGKMTIELKSSISLSENPQELEKYDYKVDYYKLYKNKEKLSTLNDESLVKIKHFLLSFS